MGLGFVPVIKNGSGQIVNKKHSGAASWSETRKKRIWLAQFSGNEFLSPNRSPFGISGLFADAARTIIFLLLTVRNQL